MLHPANTTVPYTVRGILSSNEFYPSYEKAGQSADCLTQMSSVHALPNKNGGTPNTGLHLQDSTNPHFLYGETTRPMYMKGDVSHPNANTPTSQIHEGPPQGIYTPTSI